MGGKEQTSFKTRGLSKQKKKQCDFLNGGGVRNEVQRLIQDQEKQLQLSPL